MENNSQKVVIRTRAIIVHEGKLLAVKHSGGQHNYALPGGHFEWGEDIRESLKREIIEELNIEPQIGRLLYINNFKEENKQSIEFFFEVTNGEDYLDTESLGGTHKHELADICWVEKGSEKEILPKEIQADLNNGTLLSNEVRYILNKAN